MTYGVSNHRDAGDGHTMDSTQFEAPGPAGTRSMSAIVQQRYGGDPHAVLRFAEPGTPSPGRGEVLVRVHAASIDRGTWHVMAGLPYPIRLAGFGVRRPRYANPGRSLAGTVVAVGADVTRLQPGDAVFGTGEAAFAPYARARADRLALPPAPPPAAPAAAPPPPRAPPPP